MSLLVFQEDLPSIYIAKSCDLANVNGIKCKCMASLIIQCTRVTEIIVYFPRRPLYPRHTGGAVPLRCLYGINRSGIALVAVVTQWFCH